MMRHSAGEWYGLVSPAGAALLPPEVPLATVEQVWGDLGAGRGLSAVIDGLVGVFGMSLGGLPPFGVISLAETGGVRVALRGDVSARLWLAGTDEPVAITGSGVTTWNERAFGEVARAELVASDQPDGDFLPVADGVVRAGMVVVEQPVADNDAAGVRVLPRVGADRPVPAREPVVEVAPPPSAAPRPEPEVAPEPVTPDAPVSDVAPEPSPVVPSPIVDAEPEPDLPGPVPAEASLVPEPTLVPQAGPIAAAPESSPVAPPEQRFEGVRSAETLVADEAPNEYDRLLFGETVLSSVEAAAVRTEEAELTSAGSPEPGPRASASGTPLPPPPPPLAGGLIGGLPRFGSPPPPPPVDLGDHDGETVLVEDLQQLLASHQIAAPVAVPMPHTAPRLVISGRPGLELDRTAIVGTRPRLTRVQGDSAPQLVTVESPNGEISRSHLELRVEGSTILAVDLNSTNGTMLLRVGSEPVRLQPNEPNILVPGDRVDLGDGVVLSFEGLV